MLHDGELSEGQLVKRLWGKSGCKVNYFDSPGARHLERFAQLARQYMINACSSGIHYGFTALRWIFSQVPHILYPNSDYRFT